MEVCLLCLCMRRIWLATQPRPFQVNRNDEGIAIASSSFFLNAHPPRVVCIVKHGLSCSCLFYHARTGFIQSCESVDGRAPSCFPTATVVKQEGALPSTDSQDWMEGLPLVFRRQRLSRVRSLPQEIRL